MIFGAGKHKYQLVESWAKCPDTYDMGDVCGVSVDLNDRVYVFNRSDNPVMVFAPNGKLTSSIARGYFTAIHHGFVDSEGSIYCADYEDHTVIKIDIQGQKLLELGKKGHASDTGYVRLSEVYPSLATIREGGDPFNRPTGVALSSSGDIFVSDGYGNARIHKFNSQGKLLLSWGEPGDDPGQFRLPHGIFADKLDRLWVADRENDRIQVFDKEGRFLFQWLQLGRPTDVIIDREGTVYITELARRISIYDPEGNLLARWGSQGDDRKSALFLAPHSVAVDSKGDIYVGEVPFINEGIKRGSSAIKKFTKISE